MSDPAVVVRPRTVVLVAVAAVVLYAIGAAALGTPPHADDSGAQVVEWFRIHQDGVRLYVWTGAIGAPLFAVIVALVRRVLPGPHRDVFLIGGIAFAATTAVQAWFWAGLALHASTLDPAVARTVFDVVSFWGPVLTGATMTMIAPVTLLGLRGHAGVPRWLGVLGLVAFVEQLVETITIFGSSGFTAPGGEMNLLLGAGLVIVWFFAFVVWAAVRGSVQQRTGAEGTTASV